MSDVRKKAYIINLKYDTWENQLWLMGDDTELAENNWIEAKRTLDSIGDVCTNSNEFFKKAITHFEKFGFMRVQK